MIASSNLLPSYYTSHAPEGQPRHRQMVAQADWKWAAQQLAQPGTMPILHPRPRAWQDSPDYWSIGICKQLEELVKTEASREEATRSLELPSLRALQKSLPTNARKTRPAAMRQAALVPHRVFYPPDEDVWEATDGRYITSSQATAIPAPAVGWTVRLVQPSYIGPLEDDLPLADRLTQVADQCWLASPLKSEWKEHAVGPQPQQSTTLTQITPQGPHLSVAHKRVFSDNTSSFVAVAKPARGRRNTISEAPPPVPPKDTVTDTAHLAASHQNLPPKPQSKSSTDATIFVCVFCLQASVGTCAHQEHTRSHSKV
ncbi:uncharacterized protein PHACADRAFT_259365 [Phanerochaete carnosa HHB-10118-sp]|uniref:Uncharacterized protein n=1 Tax=Phanerochaete carnosa (strain HHB-10118-sp) TaxID=650164 RepID=K5W2N6_PHACS|nr:uncharacterized protein PHACADRAFT_259365 [Phanerochaete carnosa HHB-10118-sp]EKM53189.1 hypothetical protein PHACADRAFT_259365 [Phanerochaete carnosa HHB-10118-sp]